MRRLSWRISLYSFAAIFARSRRYSNVFREVEAFLCYKCFIFAFRLKKGYEQIENMVGDIVARICDGGLWRT